ncbi:hypothetical protein BH09ACT13_BH09ACT13_07440 [soil metagenome]
MLALASAVAAVAIAPSAYAALFFLFKPTSAAPGERVTVRLGGTPAGFTLADRKKPFKRAIRLYLVPNRIAGDVRSRFDPRLHFVGRLVPDKNSRGLLTFTVPPVDTDDYAVAAWCLECARYSFGRTFFTLPVPTTSRYRDLMHLRVTLPPATDGCPVTIPNGAGPPPGLAASPSWHGNGFLWTGLQSDGVFVPSSGNATWPGDPAGSIGTKLFWFAAHEDGLFTLSGRRLDSPSSPPLVVHRVNRGTLTGFRGTGTWATPVTFPSGGCWRLTARVSDITLSYVVKVVSG